MVNLPWRRSSDDEDEPSHEDAAVVCEFQDGTLVVYDDRVLIERARRSKFDDRVIAMTDVTGVDYDAGITIGYLQIEQRDFETSSGSLFSDPVDENTVHFGRGDRDCATEARDAILERAGG